MCIRDNYYIGSTNTRVVGATARGGAAVMVAVAEVDAAVVVVQARVSFPLHAGKSYRPSVAALWTNSMNVSRLSVRDDAPPLQLLTRVLHLLLQRALKVARAPRQLIMVAINNKQQTHLQHSVTCGR